MVVSPPMRKPFLQPFWKTSYEEWFFSSYMNPNREKEVSLEKSLSPHFSAHTNRALVHSWCRFFTKDIRLMIRLPKKDYKKINKNLIPLLTLRPRLLFSFKGSTMLRCFWGNERMWISSPLNGTENDSTQFLRKSLLSNKSPPSFSGVSAGKSQTTSVSIKHKIISS